MLNNSELISAKIEQFINSYFNSNTQLLVSDRSALRLHIGMISHDPVIRFCVENTFLYLFSILGDYQHPDDRIRDDIRNSIVAVNGSWPELIKKMSSCFWLGYSWTEVAFSSTELNRLVLSEMNTVSPLLYDFEGKNNQVESIVVYKNGLDTRIPYAKGLHLVTGNEFNFDNLYGCGRCRTAAAYQDLHIILMGVLAIAAQRQATPILVKRTDLTKDVEVIDPVTGEIVKDINGAIETIPNSFDAVQQLSALSGSGVTAIDLGDDLFQIEPKIANDFLMQLLKFIESQKMMAFLVPQLVGSTSASGLGDSALGVAQRETFQLVVRSMADFLNEQLIEQLFRPLITYNFGEQDSYGYMEIRDPNIESMAIADRLISCLNTGVFSPADLDALDRLRLILKLP